MKTITLTQPWAMLVAIGAKKIETRSWGVNYTGPLAIHSAKAFPDWAKEFSRHTPYVTKPLIRAGIHKLDDLPLGYVLATCELVKVEKITMFTELPTDPEFSLGNYEVGRYMWHLAKVKRLIKPVPASGSLGLWDWEPPEEI